MKLLVVDDEDLMRELLVDIFDDGTNEILSANNGETALASYTQFKPDAILLDIMMPKMNGFEVCRQIRNVLKDSKTQIYLLTGMGDKENVIEQGLNSGANQVLFKPISSDELIKVVLK